MPKNKKYRNIKIVYENTPFKKNIEFISFSGTRSDLLRFHITPKMAAAGYFWGRSQTGKTHFDDVVNYVANGKLKPNEQVQYYHPIKNNLAFFNGRKLTNYDSAVVRIINLHYSRKRKKKTV